MLRRMLTILSLVGLVAGAGCATNDAARLHSLHAEGVVWLIPGVANTRFQLREFASRIRQAHPEWQVDIRTWGDPLRSFRNLESYERNMATARELAEELAAFRNNNPEAVIDVVGYSGGGGIAVFVVESLPADVQINRLILIAPAISPQYPLKSTIIPRISEYVVNYASVHDLQAGWGTKNFGTMDRKNVASAGFEGFGVKHPQLVQVFWNSGMIWDGHFGNHLSYLSHAWQRKYVLPALDPKLDAEDLQALFRTRPTDAEDSASSEQP